MHGWGDCDVLGSSAPVNPGRDPRILVVPFVAAVQVAALGLARAEDHG